MPEGCAPSPGCTTTSEFQLSLRFQSSSVLATLYQLKHLISLAGSRSPLCVLQFSSLACRNGKFQLSPAALCLCPRHTVLPSNRISLQTGLNLTYLQQGISPCFLLKMCSSSSSFVSLNRQPSGEIQPDTWGWQKRCSESPRRQE